jgi:Carbohydrate family 9 binding domain-like
MKRIAFSAFIIFAYTVAAFAQTTPQRAVIATATAVASASRPQPKRLATIRSLEATEGSRVVITSDASLSDYQAFADNGRFYVLIPTAVEPTAQHDLQRGRGFTNVEIGQRGDDVMISFILEAGARASVNQRFNRLEVLFTTGNAQEGTVQVSSALTPAPTPTPAPVVSSSPAPTSSKTSSDSSKATAAPASASGSAAPAKAVTVSRITLPPEKANPVRLSKFDKPPVIDGKLDDAVWQNATVLKDFYQTSPGDNIAPSKPTETMISYDAKFLYFGFHCFDEPDKVRATVAKRDGVLDTEDSIRVLLDTFNDQRKAYVLVFNPFGVQQDGIRTEGSGVDFSVDIVMESKGTLTTDGYTVEVAIPFKSLRYEAGKDKLWGLRAHYGARRYLNRAHA